MGGAVSRSGDLQCNDCLLRFTGRQPLGPNEPFWNQLLSFTYPPPASLAEQQLLEQRAAGLCRRLQLHNPSSGNLGALLTVFLGRAAELLASAQTDNALFGWQAYNALFILRCVCKHLLQEGGEDELVHQLQARPQPPADGRGGGAAGGGAEEGRLELLLHALTELLADVPVRPFTYPLHVEAAHCLLALLAARPLLAGRPADGGCVYQSLLRGRPALQAPQLVRRLLLHFSEQRVAPPGLYRGSAAAGGGSLVLALASGLWSVLTLGLGGGSGGGGGEAAAGTAAGALPGEAVTGAGAEDDPAPLATRSLLLLLVLVNHCTGRTPPNPYRQALFSFSDVKDVGSPAHGRPSPPFRLDIGRLYAAVCAGARRGREEATLLAYLLLHRNTQVRAALLDRTDLHLLVEPLLRTLYRAPSAGSHHIYMALIVLLILSEDERFNATVHDTALGPVPWYSERAVSQLSLGGLLVLVVLRTVQYNMVRMRDRYLHTNCLAALANMSGQFRALHPYVTQRLVSLFESLARRHARLVAQLQQATVAGSSSSSVAGGSSSETEGGLQETLPAGATAADPDMAEELGQDVAVLEEVLRMVLEIVNSCLSHQLAHNPNLVYSLLHRRAVFAPFQAHPAFQDIAHNIHTVLEFFSEELAAEAAAAGGGPLSVAEVQTAIQRGAARWPSGRLRKFPDLRFKYVEEERPEEFFIPYVWGLAVRGGGLHWDPQRLQLFAGAD